VMAVSSQVRRGEEGALLSVFEDMSPESRSLAT
jgi:hypothetical protein